MDDKAVIDAFLKPVTLSDALLEPAVTPNFHFYFIQLNQSSIRRDITVFMNFLRSILASLCVLWCIEWCIPVWLCVYRIYESHRLVSVLCERFRSRSSRVWLMVPVEYLDRFDSAIRGFYPSRSEAIRQGMGLILRDVASMKKCDREPSVPAGPEGKKEDTCVEVVQ